MIAGKTIELVQASKMRTDFHYTDGTELSVIIQINGELSYLYFNGDIWYPVNPEDLE